MSDGRRRFLERLVARVGSNWREALAVRVTDEQLPMVAEHQPVALVILAKAFIQPEDWFHRFTDLGEVVVVECALR